MRMLLLLLATIIPVTGQECPVTVMEVNPSAIIPTEPLRSPYRYNGLKIKHKNVTDKDIRGVEFLVISFNAVDNQSRRYVVSSGNTKPAKEATTYFPSDAPWDAKLSGFNGTAVVVNKVRFSDGTIWENRNENECVGYSKNFKGDKNK